MIKKTRPHTIGLLGLTMASLTTMIGSGWMLASWKMSRLAGPAAIIAWCIGAFIVFLLALTYAALGSRHPSHGGMVRYTQLSHGSFAGFISGWSGWISIAASTAIEAVSTVQYAHSWKWAWAKRLYDTQKLHLTHSGFIFAILLLVSYFLMNYWSIRFFIRFNIALTIVKIAIPLITCLALFYATLQNYHTINISHGNFMPYGIKGIFTACSTGGVIFAFLGFQTPVNLSGEAQNPGRDVPLAIFFSIILTTLLYILLQIAFLGALSPADLINGWSRLNISSPYVYLALALNMQWLVTTIYIGAFVSPLGAGMMFTTTSSRMLYGLQKNGYMPSFIGKLDPVFHVPRAALFVQLFVALGFLWIFRGWSSLVSVVSVAILIAFANGPISALSLKDHIVEHHVPLKIKGLLFIAPIAFVIVSLALYWAKWPLTGQVILIILAGLIIYCYYQFKQQWQGFKQDGKSGIWLVCYLLTIALISYIGSTNYGGKGWLNEPTSTSAIIIAALIYFYWGIKSRKKDLPSD